MKKSAIKKSRWTFECSDEVKKPKKPGHLRVAVDRLGPFKFETEAEARRHGLLVKLPDGEPRDCSRELAKKLVEDMAWRFNAEQHLARDASRLVHVLRQYEVIRDTALAHASALETLDDIGRYELLSVDLKAEPGREMKDSQAYRLYVDEISRLRKRDLDIDRVEQNLINSRKNTKGEAVDRGGKPNLWYERRGSPYWGLVHDALTVFNLFKAGEAIGYGDSDFQQFVNDASFFTYSEPAASFSRPVAYSNTWLGSV
jgi:hypothetical protein